MAKNDDLFNLRLLAFLHTMSGVVMMILTIAPIIYFFFIISIMEGKEYYRIDTSNYIVIYLILSIFICILSTVLTTALFMSGDRLAAREFYQYCRRAAYIECILFPLGTVLGILTLKCLAKESIQKLFVENSNDKTSS